MITHPHFVDIIHDIKQFQRDDFMSGIRTKMAMIDFI